MQEALRCTDNEKKQELSRSLNDLAQVQSEDTGFKKAWQDFIQGEVEIAEDPDEGEVFTSDHSTT